LPCNGILPGAQFSLCPRLAFSYIGSVSARHSSSGRQPNCGVEQGAPPIFVRAAIVLGIGPHSRFTYCKPLQYNYWYDIVWLLSLRRKLFAMIKFIVTDSAQCTYSRCVQCKERKSVCTPLIRGNYTSCNVFQTLSVCVNVSNARRRRRDDSSVVYRARHLASLRLIYAAHSQ